MRIITSLNSHILRNVTVITRYCAIERPYWLAFLNHYKSLGVMNIHVCVQKKEEYEEVHCFKNPDGLNVICHMLSDDCSPDLALIKFDLSDIKVRADLVMHIDCDEYFVAGAGSLAVEDIFNSHNEPVGLDIPWIMNPVIDPSSVPAGGYFGAGTKQIARAKDIIGVLSDHKFLLRKKRYFLPKWNKRNTVTSGHLYGFGLVHYWSRSFRDCLLKVFLNRFENFKSSDQAEALTKIRAGGLPNRLKLLALLEVQPRVLDLQMPVIAPFDTEAEESLLRKYISADDEKMALASYVSYRETLLGMDRRDIFYPHATNSLMGLGDMLP